ncbi:GrpB family protein [Streptomyces sp. NPDC015032]|uniref:GrpB family protein n=1 Tax=Streptomyces sp. NPDC015032 TaxID=3364937 RepID=UPI0036F58787
MVSDYEPHWSERFEDLRQRLAPHVADLAVSIEHVGSTQGPGHPRRTCVGAACRGSPRNPVESQRPEVVGSCSMLR